MYPPHLVAPMAQELEVKGFTSLKTANEVAEVLENQKGTDR